MVTHHLSPPCGTVKQKPRADVALDYSGREVHHDRRNGDLFGILPGDGEGSEKNARHRGARCKLSPLNKMVSIQPSAGSKGGG
jgi:hypothetical protein